MFIVLLVLVCRFSFVQSDFPISKISSSILENKDYFNTELLLLYDSLLQYAILSVILLFILTMIIQKIDSTYCLTANQCQMKMKATNLFIRAVKNTSQMLVKKILISRSPRLQQSVRVFKRRHNKSYRLVISRKERFSFWISRRHDCNNCPLPRYYLLYLMRF